METGPIDLHIWPLNFGYKYGKPENRPAKIRNPHDYGSVCFDGETLVATENGFKAIKDIQIGDKVFTHKGVLHIVKNTMKRIANDVIKLHVGTQDIITTKNHPFYICSSRGGNFRFEKAQNLSQKNMLVLSPCIKLKKENNNISKNQAFLLGLFLANGNISYRSDIIKPTLTSGLNISINAEYKEIYEKLFAEMGYETTYHLNNGNSAYFHIKSNELRDFIVEYGKFNYKDISYKFISSKVLNWSNELKISLLQGFFAGDGQYGSSFNKLNMRFLNTNKYIIEMLYLIIRSLGIYAKCFKFEREPRLIR